MANSLSDDWYVLGKHAIRLEPPDVLHTRPNGDISLNDAIGMMNFVKSLPRPEKGFFGLVDMTHAGRQDPAITKHPDAASFLAVYRAQAFYNATFSKRTMIGIFERVRRLLSSGVRQSPIVIFATEAEARSWIENFRNEDRGP